MAYGDKRDYRKIDIFVNGAYRCSTTWSRNQTEAKEQFLKKNFGLDPSYVTTEYDQK